MSSRMGWWGGRKVKRGRGREGGLERGRVTIRGNEEEIERAKMYTVTGQKSERIQGRVP